MDRINSNIPPAIMKLYILIPNKERICVPPKANTINSDAAVIIASWEVLFFSFLSIFVVSAMKTGTLPIGSMTTNNAIIDLARSDRNSGERMIESIPTIEYNIA